MFIISLLQIYAIFHKIARDNTEKTQTFPRHLQIFSRFSFAIEVQREEMRKIIMIKVILVIFGGGTFVSVAGGTFETAMPGTFHSVTGGTFETVPIS